ncbi:MAG: hypothetical protein NT049_15090 [Planctomycetota bacterium]|nr:hypothetical protein [Planctomycetota bacterium]
MKVCAALLCWWVLAASSALDAATAEDAEKATEAFQSLFGADLKRVKETSDTRDDAELAAKLLEAADKASAHSAFVALLCEKAGELGGANPAGYATAAAAYELLAKTVPQRAAECADRLMDIRQKQYDAARPTDKKAAGEALLDSLLPAAEAKTQAGADVEAAALYRRAQMAARAVDSPRRAEVEARADALAARMQAVRQTAELKVLLEKDPANVGTRERLVRLYVVELDDPAEAAKHLEGVKDAALLKNVPAAAKGIEAASEASCLELADWYRSLAEAAPAAVVKAAVYARAKAWLARFLEIHPAQDIDRTRATLALAKIDEAAGKLGVPLPALAKPQAPSEKSAPPVQQVINLIPLVDPEKDCHEGSCELKSGGLSVFSKAGGRMTLPLRANGSYEAGFAWKRTWGPGQVSITLPAGSGDVTVVMGAVAGVYSGLAKINGKGADKNETTLRPAKFENNRVYRITAQVKLTDDQAEIAVQLDGQPYLSWNGPQSALSAGVPALEHGCLGLGLWGAGVQFSEAWIKMLSGEAKPLRPSAAPTRKPGGWVI